MDDTERHLASRVWKRIVSAGPWKVIGALGSVALAAAAATSVVFGAVAIWGWDKVRLPLTVSSILFVMAVMFALIVALTLALVKEIKSSDESLRRADETHEQAVGALRHVLDQSFPRFEQALEDRHQRTLQQAEVIRRQSEALEKYEEAIRKPTPGPQSKESKS